jgi:hypothetical protein
MDKCKLCGHENEKFPKSHIIPNFMYKSLKNQKSQIFRIRMPEGKHLRPIFSGFYESPLLCDGCEAKINVWENYAEKVLYGSTHIKMPVASRTQDPLIQFVENIEYSKFKLFLLSILWRASVANHKFFREIVLGDKHEKRLAQMLLNENPGEEDQYPVMIINPQGSVGSNVSIGQPYKNKSRENSLRYVFPISEWIYMFHISNHGLEELQKKACLKKNNTMNIIHWPTSRVNAFLQLYQVKNTILMDRKAKLYGRSFM